jgi:uncharacterized protein YjgD (DUF1641 family)
MASDEIYELVIRMRPEGAEETQDTLEEAQETFEETAETAEEEAGILDRFARRWRGAMTVIAASLAVVSSALLANMPIVSDLMDGLRAIVEATALVIDDKLRPALEPLVNDMFALAEAIGNRDGEGVLAALDSMEDTLNDLRDAAANIVVDIIFTLPDIGRLLLERATPETFIEGFEEFILNLPGVRIAGALARRLFGMLPEQTQEHLSESMEFVSEFADWLIDKFTGVRLDVDTSWGDIYQTINDYIGRIGNVVQDMGVDIPGMIRGLTETGREHFDAFVERVITTFTDWRDDLTELVDDTIERAETRFTNFRAWVNEVIPDFGDTFGRLGTTIKNRFIGPLEQAFSRAMSIVATLREKANEAIDIVSGLTGIDLRGIGETIQDAFRGIGGAVGIDIGGYQTGGRVTGTGLAMVHAGETIEPASVERTGDPNRGSNRFAERQQMVIRFEPRQFEQFMSAELENAPANTGRGSGPR